LVVLAAAVVAAACGGSPAPSQQAAGGYSPTALNFRADGTPNLTGLTLHGSSAKSGRMSTIRGGGLHLVVTGEVRGSSVRVKNPWRWPWQRR